MAPFSKFEAGTKIIVDVTDKGFKAKLAARDKDSIGFSYIEGELLADITPEKAHADELAKLMASEFGD